MACVPLCSYTLKFTSNEIGRLADRPQNILENSDSRTVLKQYLHEMKRRDLTKVFELWETADAFSKTVPYHEDSLWDYIDDISDFNRGPLLTASEDTQKLVFIKGECARILGKIHKDFITYLKHNHKK